MLFCRLLKYSHSHQISILQMYRCYEVKGVKMKEKITISILQMYRCYKFNRVTFSSNVQISILQMYRCYSRPGDVKEEYTDISILQMYRCYKNGYGNIALFQIFQYSKCIGVICMLDYSSVIYL